MNNSHSNIRGVKLIAKCLTGSNGAEVNGNKNLEKSNVFNTLLNAVHGTEDTSGKNVVSVLWDFRGELNRRLQYD